MAFCGAVADTSVQRNVWRRSQSQDWWDSYMRGFTDTEFINNFRSFKNLLIDWEDSGIPLSDHSSGVSQV